MRIGAEPRGVRAWGPDRPYVWLRFGRWVFRIAWLWQWRAWGPYNLCRSYGAWYGPLHVERYFKGCEAWGEQ